MIWEGISAGRGWDGLGQGVAVRRLFGDPLKDGRGLLLCACNPHLSLRPRPQRGVLEAGGICIHAVFVQWGAGLCPGLLGAVQQIHVVAPTRAGVSGLRLPLSATGARLDSGWKLPSVLPAGHGTRSLRMDSQGWDASSHLSWRVKGVMPAVI